MKLIEKLAKDWIYNECSTESSHEIWMAGFRKAREMVNARLIELDSFDWESTEILSVGEQEMEEHPFGCAPDEA